MTDFDKYLSFVEAKLYLLLQISQTRFGATAVVSAGLFQAVRDSALFAIDPDYGIGSFLPPSQPSNSVLTLADAPDASIKKLFELLLAFMRVINCCVISRGSQNEQTMALARKFISDNRLNIMTIFKRSEMGTPNNTEIDECVDELAEAYTLLITISGFIDVSGPWYNQGCTRN